MNWMRYRLLYVCISAIVILAGVFSLFKWGLKIGVDFKGGSLLEYKFEKSLSTETAIKEIETLGLKSPSIQTSGSKTYLIRLAPISDSQRSAIKKSMEDLSKGNVEELRFEIVGPSIGPELVKKTIYAMILATSTILLWIAYQFKSIKFGVSATLATLHDSLVVIGIYSLLGHFFGAEVDFLFVTALLTILSFSVHDTIVVYDRIRETLKKEHQEVRFIADKALSETMVRSFNNSVTVIFMLLALILMGGTSVKWFAVTLLIGTISGTYSSPFVAVPILVTWNEIQDRLRNRRKTAN